ncbi:helix-turn-helix domain-containing protein [Pokkaliibacter sp. CJK22405]|uniref:helix-turn-helix domain-containing protein n=1 Tax=Pokkaliibacter sp. CJK22405 TaxID=3384615 RepID=UPI003984F8AD
MDSRYQVLEELKQHRTQLRDSALLSNGIGLASWYNDQDLVALEQVSHHTLSMYVADGYESYMKTRGGWKNGGGPGRMCLMPKGYDSTWNIKGPLTFVHFYFTDQHLSDIAEKTWDKRPSSFTLDERIFAEDPQITLLYRQFLLACDWGDKADQLLLSSTSSLMLTHMARQYLHCQWELPRITGGLAPFQLARVREFIDAHLDQPLLLSDLAEQAGLSDYHFARMFKQSQGLAPHQYVMATRLARAEQLLITTEQSLSDIALNCGFSSSSHFSNRFRQHFGTSPSQRRSALV